MKIRILAVKYSSNLGDGVIAECLESELRRELPGCDIDSVDLSGKSAFAAPGLAGTGRGARIARVTVRLPSSLAPVVTGVLHWIAARFFLAKRWRLELAHADRVVIGGGQIFQDAGFYFPVRLHTALQQLPAGGVPIHIYAVGVGSRLHWVSRRLFLSGLGGMPKAQISVRDLASAENARALFGGDQGRICRDPALLAADVYGHSSAPEPIGQRPRVAVCLSDPEHLEPTVRWDAEPPLPGTRLFTSLVERLVAEGYDCQLFTAGAEGDYAFAEHVLESLPDDVLADGVALAPRPQKPAELVQLVADSDAVIAQRMHPTIIAYALRRPSVGLGWNQKLDSFFTSVDRAGYCVPATDLCVDRVIDLLAQALAEGIPADRHAAVTGEARANIQSLARALR